MDDLTLPPSIGVSFGTLALAVIVVYAVRGFFRGVARLAFGMASLAAGGWVGHQFFLNGRDWLTSLLGEPPGTRTVLYAAWAAGGFTYAALGLLGRNLGNRLAGSGKALGPARLAGALLSLIPSTFLVGLAAVFIHWTGLVADLDATDRSVTAPDGSSKPDAGFLVRAREAVLGSWVGRALKRLTGSDGEQVDRLSRLLLVAKDIDAWEQLRSHPEVAAILDDPKVRALLERDSVRRSLETSDLSRLVTDDGMVAAARDPEVASRLRGIPVAELVNESLFGAPVPVNPGTRPQLDGDAAAGDAPRAIPVAPTPSGAASGEGEAIPRAVPVRRRRHPGPKRGAF